MDSPLTTFPPSAIGHKRGRIQLILGPMFSGKTTELIRRCKRFQIANCRCAVVKYAKDTRYSVDELATHDRQTLCADLQATRLADVLQRLQTFDVVGVDEGQFFPDLVEVAESLADAGKTIIVAALDGTFAREGFPTILALIPKAEEVMKLTAVCMLCYKDASFTKRKDANQTKVEVIGGTDTYLAVCRLCHKLSSPDKLSSPSKTQQHPLKRLASAPVVIPPRNKAILLDTQNCAQASLDAHQA